MIILIISVSASIAQITFEKMYGNDQDDVAYAVLPSSDGGYIIVGDVNWSQYRDIYVVKTDQWGDTLWTRQYVRNWSENARTILETSDGFIMAGYAVTTLGPARTDVYLVKINSQGDTMWTNTIGGPRSESAFDMEATSDGGFIIGGQAEDNTGQMYYYLVKTNSMGDSLWAHKYGISNEERAYGKAVKQTWDGGFIITGYVDDYTIGPGTGYIYLVKTDNMGGVEWTESYDWPDFELAYDLEEISDGYVLVGRTSSLGAGGSDAYMMKINGPGAPLWIKTYGDSSTENAYSVEKTSDGGFIISGTTYSKGAGSGDFYLIKTDANGDTMWTRTFGGSHREEAYDVKQTADGGYVLTGYSYSYPSIGSDFYLVKTDGNGLVPIQHHKDQPIVQDYKLFQNYPNPFNPTTTIEFSLPHSGYVSLRIFNILGEEVATLLSASLLSGFHQVVWNASELASGVYWYKLKAGDYFETRKMILLK
jgi:hypothetical protein